MKAVILYRPQSEFSRMVEEYVRDFEKRTGKSIELLSLDAREGAAKAALYGIWKYPALIVTQDDGQLMKDWQGEQLPLMSEVTGYLQA